MVGGTGSSVSNVLSQLALSPVTGHPFSAVYEEVEFTNAPEDGALKKTVRVYRNSEGSLRSEFVADLGLLGRIKLAFIYNAHRNEQIWLSISDKRVLGSLNGDRIGSPAVSDRAWRFGSGVESGTTTIEGVRCSVFVTNEAKNRTQLAWSEDLQVPLTYTTGEGPNHLLYRYRDISSTEPSGDRFIIPSNYKPVGLFFAFRRILRYPLSLRKC